jgi:hypothetical protein
MCLVTTWLRIKVHKGTVNFATKRLPYCEGFEHQVTMGRSVGVRGIEGTCTIGCWVYDRQTSERFAITNGHVCSMAENGKLQGFPFTISREDAVMLVSPSDDDYTRNMKLTYSALRHANVDARMSGYQRVSSMKIRSKSNAHRKTETRYNASRSFGRVEWSCLSITDVGTEGDTKWKDVGIIQPNQSKLMTVLDPGMWPC